MHESRIIMSFEGEPVLSDMHTLLPHDLGNEEAE